MMSHRWMKDIHCIHCFLSTLFVAKDKINPRRQWLADNVRLKSLTVNEHKQSCIVVAPRRQLNITNSLTILHQPKVKPCTIVQLSISIKISQQPQMTSPRLSVWPQANTKNKQLIIIIAINDYQLPVHLSQKNKYIPVVSDNTKSGSHCTLKKYIFSCFPISARSVKR